MLLRRAITLLKGLAARVTLLAPQAAGSALLGPGPSEADALLSWDDPALGALLAGEPPRPASLTDALRRHDAAVVYSRSEALASGLSALLPRVVLHDPAPPGPEHAGGWYARPALALFPSIGPQTALAAPPPDLVFTQAERALAAAELRGLPDGFLALHPGSGSPRKNWPAGRFAALAASESPGRSWLLVLGPAESDAPLARAPGARVLRAPARVVAAALAQAGAYVGNDSGVSHLAAAAGTPTLALFGPTDPALWSPLGRRVATLRARDQRLDSIPVEEVGAALARLRREQGGDVAR